MSAPMDPKHCEGCYNDHYNRDGNSNGGKCWSRDGATRSKWMLISVDAPPPYSRKATQTLPDCYTAQRFVKVKPESLTAEGYWR